MNLIVDRMLELAKIAFDNGDVPVGAVVVKNNEIIGYGFNTRHVDKSVVGHAEIMAIEMACRNVGDWRLNDCELYVSLMPCMMCTGAILESRIKRVYYLCNRINVCFDCSDYLDIIKIDDDLYESRCLKLLQLFFENKRNKD